MYIRYWEILWLLFVSYSFIQGCNAQDPKYSFVSPGTSAPPVLAYDYIIVGGGTTGCALAATLSEGADVLVLERGGSPYGNKDIEHISGYAYNQVNLLPTSPAQQFISEDGVYNLRARVLGGGSCINAGFYTRASPAYVAANGWDGVLANQSYEWVENKVAFQPPMLQFQSAVRDGLIEAGVLPFNGFTYDHMYGTKVGGTIFDSQGKRHTAADLLEYANPARIQVYLDVVVHKVVFEKTRAVGVTFMDTNGVIHQANLRPGERNEVILSAGTIGSTQLLMLSGIGPAQELAQNGIEVILDQPMVGQGLADNPMNALFIPSPAPVETSLIQVVGITDFDSYIEAASGSAYAVAISRNLPRSSFLSTVAYDFLTSLVNGTVNSGIILEKAAGPKSKGFLRLKSADPNDTPSVTFNYFEDPEDLATCVKGMETIKNVINSNAFSKFQFPLQKASLFITMASLPMNLRPRHLDTAFNMERFCRDTVMTIWHYHGGCQVGKVVDKDYRVTGVTGLRVIDSSTYLDSPGTNPQATCMMLGRYMGVNMMAERDAAA